MLVDICMVLVSSADGHFFLQAFPIEYGHIFMVPATINQHSCSWDKRMLGFAMKIASEVNNAAFRVFFDNGTSVVPDRMFFQVIFQNLLPSCSFICSLVTCCYIPDFMEATTLLFDDLREI
jgi:hypothetical protein